MSVLGKIGAARLVGQRVEVEDAAAHGGFREGVVLDADLAFGGGRVKVRYNWPLLGAPDIEWVDYANVFAQQEADA